MIENLEEKLNGDIPVNRDELFDLVSSWGRTYNGDIYELKKYDLSKLDVSQITNMISIFEFSLFDGDISKWDTSNVTNMTSMFMYGEFNRDISNWDISNIKHMSYMFYGSQFCGDISKWEFNKDVDCLNIFCENRNFQKKYNNEKYIPNMSENFLIWFEDNRINIANANISKEEKSDIEDYLNEFNDKEIKYND